MTLAGFGSVARETFRSKTFIAASVILFLVFAAAIYSESGNASASPRDTFLSISTLDSNMLTSSYFSHSNATVIPGDNMHWNIEVANHMGQAEYLSIRARVLNSSQAAPDDTLHSPGAGPVVFEKRLLLTNNSTEVIPLNWTVSAYPNSADLETYRLATSGNSTSFLNISKGEKNLRMVIELWRFDKNIGDFSFSWPSQEGEKEAWNLIWFSTAR